MNSSDQPPHADVYAGDLSAPDAPDQTLRYFHITADAEPGAFARIANVLNIVNKAPSSVVLERRGEGRLSVYAEIDGIGLATADSIARKLAQLTDIVRVDMGAVP
jgi:hypothetical protein